MTKYTSMTVAAALLVVLVTVQPARADWLLTPQLGATFGGDAETERLTYGAAIGWMGAGAFGFEVDAGFTPRYFDRDGSGLNDIEDSNVTTVMLNLILGAPLGAPGLRPYATAGAGILRTRASSLDEVFDFNENHLGVNVGAGVIAFITNNFGIRGDVRYFRNIRDSDAGDTLGIDLGNFDFWRATVGGTIRF
jgi:opacity protein-like surface antigen